MKTIKFIIFMISLLLTVSCQAKENVVITAPIDSRPISIEYLQSLVEMSGDKFIMPDKSALDMFSNINTTYNKIADSKKVRKDIENNVKNNNNENTTVIINTSTYMNGGLIGSWHYNNYNDYETSLNDLSTLTNKYSKPYYYVNSIMPRTLPEDRGNTIWPDNTKVKGLGYFYVKYNKNKDIEKTFSKVTPSELLVEWSYVTNKENEGYKLTAWEKEFLSYFNNTYLNNKKYAQYISNYKGIFEKSSIISKRIINMVENGQIDEAVICVGDVKLPAIIENIEKTQPNNNWVQRKNGNAIKFGWSRTYFETSRDSIYNHHKKLFGEKEFNKSLNCTNSKINYIFGVDEIPQMIYARDLSRRSNLSTNFNINYDYNLDKTSSKNYIGVYDTVSVENNFNRVTNFINNVSLNTNKINKDFNIYVNQYLPNKQNTNEQLTKDLLTSMFNDFNNGKNIGLIENYSFDVIANNSNDLFMKLINPTYLSSIGLTNNSVSQLGCYSSWNTIGNAIGLGMAHAQVLSISEQTTNDNELVALYQAKILSQHLLEDGIYAGQLKSIFTKDKYDLSNINSTKVEQKLKHEFIETGIIELIVQNDIRVNDEVIDIKTATIDAIGFPWLRKFDCFVDIDFK